MALILTGCLPYNFVLRKGTLRQPELDHLLLCICEAVAKMSQFWKGFGKD